MPTSRERRVCHRLRVHDWRSSGMVKAPTFRARCETEQTPERVLEIIRVRLGPDASRSSLILGDWQGGRQFVGEVGSDWFTVRRARLPASVATPILRVSIAPSAGGTSLKMALVLHPWMRVGLISQIVLVVALTTLGVLGGLRNPIFFLGALFVVVVQLIIVVSAYLARRRDWHALTQFVCAAVGGSQTSTS